MSYLTSARKSDRNICLQLFDQWNESYQFFPTNLLSVQFLFGNSFQKYLAMYCFSCLNNFIKCICSCENSTLKDITLMSSLRSLVQVVKAPCIFFSVTLNVKINWARNYKNLLNFVKVIPKY